MGPVFLFLLGLVSPVMIPTIGAPFNIDGPS
jgi:hypothetical protein